MILTQPALAFDHIIGLPGRDGVRKMIPLADGGFAAIGWQAQEGIYQDGAGIILRLDADGHILWSRALTSTGRNQGAAVAEASDGRLFISLEEYPQQNAPGQVVVLEFSADGQQLNQTSVGGPGKEVADVIKVLPGGDLLLAGEQSAAPEDDMAAWVTRLDSTGRTKWSWIQDTEERDRINAVVALDDGSFIAAGNSTAAFADKRQEQPLFVRLSAQGEELWVQEPKVGRPASVRALAALDDGSVLFAGYAKRPGTGEFDGWIGRLDADGALLWHTPIADDGPGFLHDLTLLEGGDALAAGGLRPTGSAQYQGLVVPFSFDGTWLEELRVDRPGSVQIRSVVQGRNGSFFLGGSLTPDGTDNEQLWLSETDLPP